LPLQVIQGKSGGSFALPDPLQAGQTLPSFGLVTTPLPPHTEQVILWPGKTPVPPQKAHSMVGPISLTLPVPAHT